MPVKQLITSFEVVDKAPTQHNLDTKFIEPFLVDAIGLLCREKCFGEEFYLSLLDDVRPAEEYDDCKEYQTGDTVVFGSSYFCALQDTTGGIDPTDAVVWMKVNKFLTQENQDLFDNYLCDYLVFSVLHAMVLNNAYQITTFGVVKNSTQFAEPAEGGEILSLKNDFQNKKETRFMLMNQFLTRKTDTIDNVSKYPLYPPNKTTLCHGECGKKRKSSINIPLRNKKHYIHRNDNHHHHDY